MSGKYKANLDETRQGKGGCTYYKKRRKYNYKQREKLEVLLQLHVNFNCSNLLFELDSNYNQRYTRQVISSMLRHGLRLICIKSYNDHNYVKIDQNLPKFGNLGKIGNLNFFVT